MSTVHPAFVASKEAKFLASLNAKPTTRFYVIEPRGPYHFYTVKDRQNSLFVKTFRDGGDAAWEARELNANAPTPKPLFPVAESSCRVTPEPLISKAITEACFICGSLCTSDCAADPVWCPKCRSAKRDAAVHAVVQLSDDELIHLGAAVADEVGRRLHSAA